MMNLLKHSLAKLKKLLRMAKWLSVKQLCSLMVLYARGSATKKQHRPGWQPKEKQLCTGIAQSGTGLSSMAEGQEA